MSRALLIGAILVFASAAHAADDAKLKAAASKFVPNAKVVKVDGSEFDLQTAKGTIVEVEVNNDGTLDEASGDAAMGGDVFVPGNGLIDLAKAVEGLKGSGKVAVGDWKLEKSLMNGWVYEFEGTENNKAMEYVISAKDGKLVKDSRDIL